jgi:hypothetical protein
MQDKFEQHCPQCREKRMFKHEPQRDAKTCDILGNPNGISHAAFVCMVCNYRTWDTPRHWEARQAVASC